MTVSSAGRSGELVIRQPDSRLAWRLALSALALAVSYYLAARLGMVMRFPNSTPSVLWPPNALLTAALLLAPPRWWWALLAVALPPHLVVELGTGWSPSIVLALYFTNCFEALLAAGGIYWLTGRRGRFDTVARTIAFLAVAVVVAPFLSSFPDAGVVSALHQEPFWQVFWTRLFSNALAALTIVPALVLTIRDGPTWFERSSSRQRVEALALALCLVAVNFAAARSSADLSPGELGPIHHPLVLTLPALLWAAVRFGPGGLSLALLFTTVMTIRTGMQGLGPFAALPPESGVLGVQLFLGAAGIPLLTLASASQERRQALSALEERLRFEEFLGTLSRAFIDLPIERLDAVLESWIERLRRFFQADLGVLLMRSGRAEDGDREELESTAAPVAVSSRGDLAELPWCASRLSQDDLVLIESLESLPSEASRDLRWLERRRARSALLIPLSASGRFLGALALLRGQRGPWPFDAALRGRLVAEVIGSALARREEELARRAAEELERDILASLPSQVAILGAEGRVLAINESWTRSAGEPDASPLLAARVGGDFLGVCRGAEESGVPGTEIAAGVLSVLRGQQSSYPCEYRLRDSGGERWFALAATPLLRASGGAVLSHAEITKLKRAEFELQSHRQELAHFNRVAAIGELTASLAHELNQPLTSILVNARVAQQTLENPDLARGGDSLATVLAALVEEARRASTVVGHSRELLSRRAAEESLFDLHHEIRIVERLVGAEALRRDVALQFDLGDGAAPVRGDRVQLQQVLLNLLLNALDAAAGSAGAAVVLRSSRRGAEIEIAVTDNGNGIEPPIALRIFEPFFTTKPHGMGMGLSICRRIVVAHGGSITASNNPGRGATLAVRLPLAGAASEPGPETA